MKLMLVAVSCFDDYVQCLSVNVKGLTIKVQTV